jgi:NiFe hydrogenase small subunit HydA
VVLNKLSVRYQPNVMAGTGQTAVEAINQTLKEVSGKYVLVVEGPVPTMENGDFCTFGLGTGTKQLTGGTTVPNDKPIAEWMKELVPGAAAVIANGSCASFGGIPAANASVTGATAVSKYVATIDAKKPVINVGGCPSHPDWFLGTVMESLVYLGVLPGAKGVKFWNENNLSNTFFGKLIHENCERRASFDSGLFLENWNDQSPDYKLCLFKMGCKGPVTYADCPTRRWNSAVNWCVGANAPCHGCASPSFYQPLAPLYKPLPNVNFDGITPAVDVLGWVAAGATAVGVGAHYLYKQLGHEPDKSAEGGEK